MEAQKVYNQVKSQHEEALRIAEGVIESFERYYGPCYRQPGYDSVSQLYTMLLYGYGDILWPILKDLNYNYAAELQTVFAMMDALVRNNQSVIYSVNWTCFYSIDNIKRIGESYVLETKEGTMVTTPITEYREDLKIWEYANRRGYYGFCHDAAERFLKEHPEYQAVTSLMPHQFGRKHYHSYVKKDGKVFDFSHNACIDEETYNRIMKPILLNEVYGYDLESEESKLGSDELGPEKCLLMRLAVAKQRRG